MTHVICSQDEKTFPVLFPLWSSLLHCLGFHPVILSRAETECESFHLLCIHFSDEILLCFTTFVVKASADVGRVIHESLTHENKDLRDSTHALAGLHSTSEGDVSIFIVNWIPHHLNFPLPPHCNYKAKCAL